VAGFFREIDGFVPAVVSHHDGLNRQHHRHDETPGGRGWSGLGAGWRTHQEATHDQADQGESGDGGCGLLYARTEANAEPLHGGERQDRASGHYGGECPDRGNQALEKLDCGHRPVSGRGHVRQKIGPTDGEPGIVAHGFTSVNIKAASPRNHGGQFRNIGSAASRVNRSGKPHQHD